MAGEVQHQVQGAMASRTGRREPAEQLANTNRASIPEVAHPANGTRTEVEQTSRIACEKSEEAGCEGCAICMNYQGLAREKKSDAPPTFSCSSTHREYD